MTHIKIHTINVQQLKSQMEQGDLCLIDVREHDEWQQVHLTKARLVPLSTLAKDIETVVSNKNQPIYLHCKAGVRSLHAAQILAEQGYTELYSIEGGIVEWIKAGYPVANQ